jgi:hypothetical protein
LKSSPDEVCSGLQRDLLFKLDNGDFKMMKVLLKALAVTAFATCAFANTATLNCSPTAVTNSSVILNTLFFNNATGTGSFLCSDASLGAVTINSVSISILTDYTKGNGSASDPSDNSAGFTFTSASTWAAAHAGAFTTTMNLATGVTVFTIGNLSSSSSTFTNTTSGGLTGTSFVQPTTDAEIALTHTSVINVSAFVDAGGFSNGVSDASVLVTYDFTPGRTDQTPEPASLLFLGSGLVAILFVGRKKLAL